MTNRRSFFGWMIAGTAATPIQPVKALAAKPAAAPELLRLPWHTDNQSALAAGLAVGDHYLAPAGRLKIVL